PPADRPVPAPRTRSLTLRSATRSPRSGGVAVAVLTLWLLHAPCSLASRPRCSTPGAGFARASPRGGRSGGGRSPPPGLLALLGDLLRGDQGLLERRLPRLESLRPALEGRDLLLRPLLEGRQLFLQEVVLVDQLLDVLRDLLEERVHLLRIEPADELDRELLL